MTSSYILILLCNDLEFAITIIIIIILMMKMIIVMVLYPPRRRKRKKPSTPIPRIDYYWFNLLPWACHSFTITTTWYSNLPVDHLPIKYFLDFLFPLHPLFTPLEIIINISWFKFRRVYNQSTESNFLKSKWENELISQISHD